MFSGWIIPLLCAVPMAFLLLGGGCSSKLPPGMPKLYPAEVVVTFDNGTPVADATVSFHPAEGTNIGGSWFIAAATDAQGKGAILTQGKYSGLPIGQYQVTVVAFVVEGEEKVLPLPPDATREQMENHRLAMANAGLKTRYAIIDQTYSTPEKTPLPVVESKKSNNLFDLKVGKPARRRIRPGAPDR